MGVTAGGVDRRTGCVVGDRWIGGLPIDVALDGVGHWRVVRWLGDLSSTVGDMGAGAVSHDELYQYVVVMAGLAIPQGGILSFTYDDGLVFMVYFRLDRLAICCDTGWWGVTPAPNRLPNN